MQWLEIKPDMKIVRVCAFISQKNCPANNSDLRTIGPAKPLPQFTAEIMTSLRPILISPNKQVMALAA
jgi:hypothetical protein